MKEWKREDNKGKDQEHLDRSQNIGDNSKKSINIDKKQLELQMQRDEVEKITGKCSKLKKDVGQISYDLRYFEKVFLDPSKNETATIQAELQSAINTISIVAQSCRDFRKNELAGDLLAVNWRQSLDNARGCEKSVNDSFKILKDKMVTFLGEGLEKYNKIVKEIRETCSEGPETNLMLDKAGSRIYDIYQSGKQNLNSFDALNDAKDREIVFGILNEFGTCLEELHEFQRSHKEESSNSDEEAVPIEVYEAQKRKIEIDTQKYPSIKKHKSDKSTYTGDSSSGSPFKDNRASDNFRQLTGKGSFLQSLSNAQIGYEKVLKNTGKTLEESVKSAMESIKNEIINLDTNLYSKYKNIDKITTSNESNKIKKLTLEALERIKRNADIIKSGVPENATYRVRLKEFEEFLSKGLKYPIDNTGSTQTGGKEFTSSYQSSTSDTSLHAGQQSSKPSHQGDSGYHSFKLTDVIDQLQPGPANESHSKTVPVEISSLDADQYKSTSYKEFGVSEAPTSASNVSHEPSHFHDNPYVAEASRSWVFDIDKRSLEPEVFDMPTDNNASIWTSFAEAEASEFQHLPKTQSTSYGSYEPYIYEESTETGAYPYMQQPLKTGADNSQSSQSYFATGANEFGQSLDSGQSSTQQQHQSRQYKDQLNSVDIISSLSRNRDLTSQQEYIIGELRKSDNIEKIKHARSLANSDAARPVAYSSHANSQGVSTLIRDDCNQLILNYELENPSSSTRPSDKTKRKKQLKELSGKEALDDKDYLEIFNRLLENTQHESMNFSPGIETFSQWLEGIRKSAN